MLKKLQTHSEGDLATSLFYRELKIKTFEYMTHSIIKFISIDNFTNTVQVAQKS